MAISTTELTTATCWLLLKQKNAIKSPFYWLSWVKGGKVFGIRQALLISFPILEIYIIDISFIGEFYLLMTLVFSFLPSIHCPCWEKSRSQNTWFSGQCCCLSCFPVTTTTKYNTGWLKKLSHKQKFYRDNTGITEVEIFLFTMGYGVF